MWREKRAALFQAGKIKNSGSDASDKCPRRGCGRFSVHGGPGLFEDVIEH